MSWDNYRQQEEYFAQPRESTTWRYFKVGLGLMLGMATVWLIYLMVVGTVISHTVNDMQVRTLNTVNAQVEKIRVQAEQRKIATEQEALRKAEERRALQRQQLEAAEAEMRERQAKEAAWERFYHKRAECENPPNNSVFVECGNEYMRAQRNFEHQWEAGKQKAEAD